ncbi:MAG: acyl-CoA dehydrogenase family protein [Bacteroidia bacterium]|nr:acyl-CoA dehydrogenase family protein [Bacteroidia bacterium]
MAEIQSSKAVRYSPGVRSMLPLFYVGWADNELSDQEKRLIQNKIEQLDFLSAKDRTLLKSWSDPATPPSSRLLRSWVDIIRASTQDINPKKKLSLVDLGVEMARFSCPEGEEDVWCADSTKIALDEIEAAIGPSDIDFFRSILTPEVFEKQSGFADETTSFDVGAMQDVLDARCPDKWKEYREYFSSKTFKTPVLSDKDEYRTQILKWCHLLGEKGYGAISYPTEYGGQDDFWGYAALFSTLAQTDLSLTIKFGVQFGLFGGSIMWLGTRYHHDKYLKQAGNLELPGCFAMTETGHGSNVNGLETTATYISESDELEIHSPTFSAGKEYIGNALHSKMASVFCQLIVNGENHGVHAVLVRIRDQKHQLLPGVSVEDNGYKLGLNGIDNGRLWFNKVRVPRTNLLNRYGDIDKNGNYSSPIESRNRRFFTMLGTLVGGRVFVPQAGLAATKKALAIAIRYGLRRQQFAAKEGAPETVIMDYPSHQARLMPLVAKAYGLHFALEFLTERFINRTEADTREIETIAAALKSYATWYTTDAIQECREACGGKGYLTENQFADLKADTDIFTTFEGDNTVLMQLVAKGLISEFRQAFHDEGFRAVMRVLLKQVSTSIFESNPIASRNRDMEHLLSSEFHKQALGYRRHRLLVSVTQRMRSMLRKKMDPYLAFLKCQTHLLRLANAYTEELIYEQFYKKVRSVQDQKLHGVLRKLRNLYALTVIYEDRGWFLESGYIESAKSKAIRAVIGRLNREVRRESLGLVEAWGIPDALLRAPIAMPHH